MWLLVSLIDQPQSLQGEEVIDFIDRFGEGHDHLGKAPGGKKTRLAQLVLDPVGNAIDQPGEAEDEPRLDRGAAGTSNCRSGLSQVDPRNSCGPLDQGGKRDL